MAQLDELVKEFLVESNENLDRLDQDFVELEKNPGAKDQLASIFRTIHTIKGTCGFLGFAKLESVTHIGETLLVRLRDGDLAVTSDIVTGLLTMVDAVREMLRSIETGAGEGNGEYGRLIAILTKLKEGGAAPTHGGDKTPAEASAADPMEHPVQDGDVAVVEEAGREEAGPPAGPEPAKPELVHEQHAAIAAETSKATETTAGGSHAGPSGIRVDVGLLDKLMNLVGELVLARNQILQFSSSAENAALAGPTQRLNLITTELQEGVMKTRMQPIDNVWSRFPRIVRDLSQLCGKKVRVEMEGRETELDKTIIEAIKDPLTHIIRNSVDHGVETPDKRAAAGKPEEGLLSLRAFHEGGQVNIEIADDGAGINVERVKKKAVERGLVTAEHAARMGEREAINLIFLPGFSTAEKLTNVSGRGVGMDVVKTNIEKIGGTVDVQSKQGAGMTLRIRIPLTLAIIPALIVTSGGDRYAIPQVSLLELVRLGEEQARSGIENLHGAPVYRLRGNLLPLVHLNNELRTGDGAARQGLVNIVVLQADERQFGLVVDEINDTEEIVVKPLGKVLKGLTTFAGATIMGDGCVALILDVMGLAQRANVVSETKEHPLTDVVATGDGGDANVQTLLLFRVSRTRRMAIKLSLVDRLEEFAGSNIEMAGDEPVVQYRGQIMPLIRLTDVLAERGLATGEKEPRVDEGETVQVIVHTKEGRSIGLIVDRIVDIVEQSMTIQRTAARAGVLGSAVIDKKVTELLDVDGIVQGTLRAGADVRPPLAMAA